MIVFSAQHMSKIGVKIVQKDNGDVVLMPERMDNSPAEEVKRVLSSFYPNVSEDIILDIAFRAAHQAVVQSIVVHATSTPNNLKNEAYQAEEVYRSHSR